MQVVGADDNSLGITTIIRDIDSDEEDGIVKKVRKRRIIDRGAVSDYEGILGTYNEQTGKWEGFLTEASNPTIQDLHAKMTHVAQQARLDRQEMLRNDLGLPSLQ